MRTRKSILLVLAVIMLTSFGCATRQHVTLKSGDKQEIYESKHAGIFSGPDNAVNAATAYLIVQKADAEASLIASYSKTGQQPSREGEALGFIINDKYAKWNLSIKTKIGRLTIFQKDVPPGKLEHKLQWGEYITVWTNGYEKYTDTLKVMPYADVRTIIKREGGKEEEVKGHWMTHLPQ